MKNMSVEVKLLEVMAKNKIRTIKEVHERTGLSRTIISDLLQGKRSGVTMETLARICEGLNCEISDLIVLKK